MSFTELIRKNIRFCILLPLVVAGVVFAVSLFKEPLYKSTLSLMVVQKQTEDINAQTGVKSAEQMADILSRVVDSVAFRAAVLNSGEVSIDLPEQPWRQSKVWQDYVKTKNITDTGILVIDVYQPSSVQATKLAEAVQKTLTDQSYGYLGVRAEDVFIRQLNPPAPTSNKPATPNLWLNAAVGWFFGLILVLSLLLIFPNANWFGWYRRRRNKDLADQTGELNISPSAKPVIPKRTETAGGMIFSPKLFETIDSASAFRAGVDHPMARPVTAAEPFDEPAPQSAARPGAADPAINLPGTENGDGGFVARANDILNRHL